MFGIAYDISVVGYDANGRHHDETQNQVMEVCQYEN